MTPEQLRFALIQQLESLQRAGVSQLPRVVLPDRPEFAANPASPEAARGASAPAARPSVSPSPRPPTVAPVRPSPRTAAPPVSPVATSSVVAPSPTSPPSSPDMARPAARSLFPDRSPAPPPTTTLDAAERRVALEIINAEVRGCSRCPELVANRSRTVFGVGTVTPRLCFFGEAPGADEDQQGEPFVGRAGQLLNKIIEAMGLRREEVYILNVLKCRPPNNRAPLDDEIENCRGFFQRQLEILRPEFICCLGASAAKTMLQSALSIGKLRGRFYSFQGAQVAVTYHPAYLLRNPAAKKDTWEDIQMLMKAMGLPIKAGP